MNIAIVGYGSLLWDLENLSPFVTGDWKLGDGPQMPVEFSRVSPKRKEALVLVIDETLDHQCQTSVIDSTRNDLHQAVNDLAARERCSHDMIGYVSARGDAYRPLDGAHEWLDKSGYDAVIWTALPGNFHDQVNQPFSHDNGLAYLKTLKGAALEEAWRYVEFAPEITDTPFRRFLRNDNFWQSLDFAPERGLKFEEK